MAELNLNKNLSIDIEIVGKPVIKELILNDDQKSAIEYFNNWFITTQNIKDDRLLKKLTGSAGTGKTTLVSAILELAKTYFKRNKICICAPTHKAKKVIKEKTQWGECETLQSLLGLKLDTSIEDFDVNNPQFNPIGERRIKEYDLVIIDEASMINSELYSTINDNSIYFGTHVLFIGDTMQLNPVKETGISPSLLSPEGYNLTKIIRQDKINPLLIVLNILREDIFNNTNTYISYLQQVSSSFIEGIGGYAVLNANEFSSKMNNTFTNELFKTNKNYCRYITWTNKSIQDVNKYIRNTIFNYVEPLTDNELLLSYKTVQKPKSEDILMVNSDDYVILKTEKGKDQQYNLDILVTKIKGVDTDKETILNFIYPEKSNLNRFRDIHDSLVQKAKNRGGRNAWKYFYDFRNSYILTENIYEDGNGQYRKIDVKKDIDYGYSITIHKSQGSTYNTVFVNGKDINLNKNEIERRRLWYVALSRASNEVYINL